MTRAGPTLAEKVVEIDAALDGARIQHAFGGALALAYYAEPRATIDIDVNVFVAPPEYRRVLAALAPLGVDAEDRLAVIERDGQARWWWGETPVDLFFSSDDIHDAMRDATRSVPFGEGRIPILGPEHLAICKAMFSRPKDWIDIEQMLVGVPELDAAEVRDWLERMVGPDDKRYVRFGELAARASG